MNLVSPSPPPFFFFLVQQEKVSLSQLVNNTKTNKHSFLYLYTHPLLEEIDEVTHIEQPGAIKALKEEGGDAGRLLALFLPTHYAPLIGQLIGFLFLLVYVQSITQDRIHIVCVWREVGLKREEERPLRDKSGELGAKKRRPCSPFGPLRGG